MIIIPVSMRLVFFVLSQMKIMIINITIKIILIIMIIRFYFAV